MKHLRAKKSFRIHKDRTAKYEIKTMALEEIVPASIYDEIPDYDELKESIKDGEMDDPLILLPMTQDYWKIGSSSAMTVGAIPTCWPSRATLRFSAGASCVFERRILPDRK